MAQPPLARCHGRPGRRRGTYAEAFTVQPFGNLLVTLNLTGAQILTALQQQYSGANEGTNRVLQVAGITYTVDNAKAGADKVVADSVRIAGQPLDPAATYRVTINDFLAGGGDGFPVFTQGTNKLIGPADIEALTAYLGAHSSATAPIAPPATDRLTFIN